MCPLVWIEITKHVKMFQWAVRSVVVSLALHARGRGFNPHIVQIFCSTRLCHIFVYWKHSSPNIYHRDHLHGVDFSFGSPIKFSPSHLSIGTISLLVSSLFQPVIQQSIKSYQLWGLAPFDLGGWLGANFSEPERSS